MIERENLQIFLTDAETTLKQRETKIQTRTVKRKNTPKEVIKVRTELEAITTEKNIFVMVVVPITVLSACSEPSFNFDACRPSMNQHLTSRLTMNPPPT